MFYQNGHFINAHLTPFGKLRWWWFLVITIKHLQIFFKKNYISHIHNHPPPSMSFNNTTRSHKLRNLAWWWFVDTVETHIAISSDLEWQHINIATTMSMSGFGWGGKANLYQQNHRAQLHVCLLLLSCCEGCRNDKLECDITHLRNTLQMSRNIRMQWHNGNWISSTMWWPWQRRRLGIRLNPNWGNWRFCFELVSHNFETIHSCILDCGCDW